MSSHSPRRLLPTTRAQVSGHRFMRRRVEHGLIFGDIRMIHDPLASRQRATIFSVVAVLLIAAVELHAHPETAYKVILNEAIELTKRYGGTDGHKFINGVLDKYAAALRPDEVRAARTPSR